MELFGDTLYAASADRIYGININNAQIIKNITVSGSTRLGHITIDTLTNILYVSDWSSVRIFKVNLNTSASSILVSTGIVTPVGVLFDENNNRIILLTFAVGTPIKAINPVNGQISNITSSIYDYLDAIARDKYGCVYVSSFFQGQVHRFDSAFTSPPVLISTGHNGPSGLGYNRRDHLLGVTNYDSNSISLITLPVISIKNLNEVAARFELYQNYPNPFNPVTIIKYELPSAPGGTNYVKLSVYDILGREAAVLVNGKLKPGTYEIEWDGTNYTSGVYFYRFITNKYVETKKMILVK
jgi:DNA-binding beta-propeller fold protein YncE